MPYIKLLFSAAMLLESATVFVLYTCRQNMISNHSYTSSSVLIEKKECNYFLSIIIVSL